MSSSLPAVAVLFAMTGLGCAMSPSAYDSLAAEVAERNRQRYEAARVDLRAEGYEIVGVALMAVLESDGSERCRQEMRGGPTAASSQGDAERIRVGIVAPNPSGGASAPHAELEASIDDACEFFFGRNEQLSGIDTTGTALDFVRVVRALARAQTGELVWVERVTNVISERTVLVEQSCNEMPSPGPDPFDLPPTPIAVIPAPAPTRQVRIEVEHEELDYECTDVVE